MKEVVARVCLVLLMILLFVPAKADELFKLGTSQNISCGRNLEPGHLKILTCDSYAYVFNIKTSEYFRCDVSLAVTRDSKEVITVQSDGYCARKPRVFDTDSSYDFEAAETAPPSTNSFFGSGGFSVWALDTRQQKVRGCVTITTGLGSDVSRCVDMESK